MRWRLLLLAVALGALQTTGCGRCCRCCGSRDSRIPPQDTRKDPLPPPDPLNGEGPVRPPRPAGTGAAPQGSPQPTGAYGGS